MHSDPVIILVALLAVGILGLSKGGFAGVGMVSTPLMSLVLPPAQAAGFILPILVLQDLISMYAYRRHASLWNLAVLLPGAVVGILIGAKLVSLIDRSMFELALGAICLIFGVERLVRYFAATPKPHRPNAVVGVICGAFAGLTSMIAHAGIPPFQFFVLPQRLERDTFIGTSVFFYGMVNLIKFPFFFSLGQITPASLMYSAAFFPVALGAVLLGIVLVRKVTSNQYVLFANLVLIGIGGLLIARGLSA